MVVLGDEINLEKPQKVAWDHPEGVKIKNPITHEIFMIIAIRRNGCVNIHVPLLFQVPTGGVTEFPSKKYKNVTKFNAKKNGSMTAS